MATHTVLQSDTGTPPPGFRYPHDKHRFTAPPPLMDFNPTDHVTTQPRTNSAWSYARKGGLDGRIPKKGHQSFGGKQHDDTTGKRNRHRRSAGPLAAHR